MAGVLAYPSAAASPAAAARPPPRASAAPARRPCQRAAAAPAPRPAPPRAITRSHPTDRRVADRPPHSRPSIRIYWIRSVSNLTLLWFSYIKLSSRPLADGHACRPILEHRRPRHGWVCRVTVCFWALLFSGVRPTVGQRSRRCADWRRRRGRAVAPPIHAPRAAPARTAPRRRRRRRCWRCCLNRRPCLTLSSLTCTRHVRFCIHLFCTLIDTNIIC